MISLEMFDPPATLESEIEEWTATYEECTESGRDVPDALARRYKDQRVKELVKLETCDKCAYCESKVTHTYPGDVEHIKPKSEFPELRFELRNLTLACFNCNNSKRNYYNETTPLLNPYEDQPSDFLIAFGTLILQKPGERRGYVTVRRLDLNRDELVERRGERIQRIAQLVDQYVEEEDPIVRELLEEQLREEAGRCKEFAFVVRAYLRSSLGIDV